MKKLFLLSLLLLTTHEYGIILKSYVIKSLDGVSPAFDGKTILDIAHLKVKFTNMNIGQLNRTTNERVGLYSFNGKKCSIAELAEIEKQKPNNPELNVILENIKVEFIKLNEKFIKQVQTFKGMVLTLMRESCQKRHIPHSFMLTCADTQAGQEEESFKRNMTSFVKLNHFLNDLCGFLQDIYDSCPKGRQQFFAILRKQKAQKA